MLGRTRVKAHRTMLRQAIGVQRANGAGGAFAMPTESSRQRARELPELPEDRREYIGPYALDPDAMRLASRIWKEKFQTQLERRADALLDTVATAAADLYEEARATPTVNRSAEMERISTAVDRFDGALALEQRLEAQFPSYQLFRTVYRDAMIDVALDKNAPGPRRHRARTPGGGACRPFAAARRPARLDGECRHHGGGHHGGARWRRGGISRR